MPNFTTRLGLTKPISSESYDVSIPNANMDIIDAAPAKVTVCTSATRPSSSVDGDIIYETDTTNTLIRQSAAWRSFNTKTQICTAATRPASGAAFGGMQIFETDTGNRAIRNAANTGWIPLAPYSVANATERGTLPLLTEGFIVYRRDTDMYEWLSNDLLTWFPILTRGTRRQLAGRTVTQAGVIHSGIAGTEVNITKAALENINAGVGLFMLGIRLSAQFTAGGMSFTVRVRKDTALSGTVITDFPILSQVAGFTQEVYFEFPFFLGVADVDLDLYLSVNRAAGAGTMDVNGNGHCSFYIDEILSAPSYQEVT